MYLDKYHTLEGEDKKFLIAETFGYDLLKEIDKNILTYCIKEVIQEKLRINFDKEPHQEVFQKALADITTLDTDFSPKSIKVIISNTRINISANEILNTLVLSFKNKDFIIEAAKHLRKTKAKIANADTQVSGEQFRLSALQERYRQDFLDEVDILKLTIR